MFHENVSDYKTSIWQKQSSSTDQFIRANKCVKILISNSKEVRIMITLRAAGKPAAYFVFVVLIMTEFLMAKLEFMVVAFSKAWRRAVGGSFFFFSMQFRIAIERSTIRRRVIHIIHTRRVHHEQYNLLTHTNMKCALCGSSLTAQDCDVIIVRMKRVCLPRQPCHLFGGLPHLLTSIPPQHETQPGEHDFLQDDTVHRAPLPEPVQSTKQR